MYNVLNNRSIDQLNMQQKRVVYIYELQFRDDFTIFKSNNEQTYIFVFLCHGVVICCAWRIKSKDRCIKRTTDRNLYVRLISRKTYDPNKDIVNTETGRAQSANSSRFP